jgi:hypothetical protein
MRDGFFPAVFIPVDLVLAWCWVIALRTGKASIWGTRWPAYRALNPARYWLAMASHGLITLGVAALIAEVHLG